MLHMNCSGFHRESPASIELQEAKFHGIDERYGEYCDQLRNDADISSLDRRNEPEKLQPFWMSYFCWHLDYQSCIRPSQEPILKRYSTSIRSCRHQRTNRDGPLGKHSGDPAIAISGPIPSLPSYHKTSSLCLNQHPCHLGTLPRDSTDHE